MDGPNKKIGGVIQFGGVILVAIGVFNGNLACGGFGALIALIGRVIAEYGNDWFD